MKTVTKLATATALATLLALPAFSQGTVVGTEALDERIEDIERDIAEDLAEGEDDERFGGNQYAQGWAGSVSLGLSATSGNTDTGDLSVGGRLRYGNGPWNHHFGFAGEIAEDNGTRNKEEAFVTYEANRYFTDRFYVFGIGSVRYDGFSTNEWDAFLGFGPGYRIVNTETVAWRVQAGPGVRYIEDQNGNDQTEGAGIASSRVYYKISDMAFLSNDTDALFSDDGTLVVNDFGVTFKMSDALAARVGYRTEYNSDPLPGLKNTDNTLNVSMVYGF